MDQRSQLHRITDQILSLGTDNPGKLHSKEHELFDLLVEASEMNTESDASRDDIILDTGKAIGSTWAALCLKEILRTKKFMDGIVQAVTDARKKISRRPVHILYVGTGPFAALVLPLTAKFSSDEVQFTLLEINDLSLIHLKKIINSMQLEKYVHRIELADGCNWKLPVGDHADIFISETMQQSLAKEPQVNIYMNIIPQLPANAIIIPEEVILNAELVDLKIYFGKKTGAILTGVPYYFLDRIYTLNRQTILTHAAAWEDAKKNYTFPETAVSIPPDVVSTHPMLFITTMITVYDKVQLLYDECSLTIPQQLEDLSDYPPPLIARFQYRTGNVPGMQYRIG